MAKECIRGRALHNRSAGKVARPDILTMLGDLKEEFLCLKAGEHVNI